MNLGQLKEALSRIAGDDQSEVVLRYTDTMGAPQVVPVTAVAEEIQRSSDPGASRVILDAN